MCLGKLLFTSDISVHAAVVLRLTRSEAPSSCSTMKASVASVDLSRARSSFISAMSDSSTVNPDYFLVDAVGKRSSQEELIHSAYFLQCPTVSSNATGDLIGSARIVEWLFEQCLMKFQDLAPAFCRS